LTSVILLSVFIVGIVYVLSGNHPASTPMLLYSYNISIQNIGVAEDVINASLGSTQHLNLTLTSMSSMQILIPAENLKLTAFNSTIDYSNNWDTSSWNTSVTQESVFNYSLSLSQLILQPNVSNSTIVTINLANNAPTGRYALEINLGDVKFLSAHGKHDQSYGSSVWLGMIVTPKAGQE